MEVEVISRSKTSNFERNSTNEASARGQNRSRNLKRGAIRMKRERGEGKEERAMGCYFLN
jgi:hypothetical protein